MVEVAVTIQFVNNVLFAALALVAYRQWRARRDEPTAWVAATFGVLAAVLLAGHVLPEQSSSTGLLWARKALMALLLLFPYALYRFAASFQPRHGKWDRFAGASFGAVLLVTAVLPPAAGAPGDRAWWWTVYVAGALAYWSTLSIYVSVQLWRAGHGKSTVARRRMRVLAAAASVLNAALLIAGSAPRPDDVTWSTVAIGVLATVSAVLFFMGFAPPRLLRVAWRRPEELALQQAQLGLMAATTPRQVLDLLLPHGMAVVGATGAALLDTHGRVVGSAAVSAEWASAHADDDADPLRLPLASGQLVLWAGPHTPYFGREELDLLARFGVVIDLAWVRCELLEHQRETMARLEEAQRIARLGAWEFDLSTGAITWSREMYRICGLEEGTPVTFGAFQRMVHPEDADVVMAETARTIEGVTPTSMDYRIVLPDGAVRTLHGQGQVVRGAGGAPARLVGTAHDITERKAAEHALNAAYEGERAARMAYERANEELESFVYSVSHDLKSPIISLLGYLDYLKLDYGSLLPPEALHYIERMSSSAGYMEALIQDLLELSRIGRVQTEPAVVDLDRVVPEVASELSASHPAASVHVDALPTLLVNPVRARQLFTNLIGNALDHGGRADVHVRVRTEHAGPDGATVVVEDDGRGIPPAYREKVFGVFERLETPDDDGGTGIGLAICRKVMDSLGGSIAVADAAQGTRMCLTFPASALAAAASTGVAAS